MNTGVNIPGYMFIGVINMGIVVIHNAMRTIHREYQVMFYRTRIDLPFQASLRIFIFQQEILGPDLCILDISHIINRNLARINHTTIGHIVHPCIEEPAQIVIYFLLVIQGRLPAIPVTVHGIGIIIALAGIGSLRNPSGISQNRNASFCTIQPFIHIAGVEIGLALFCFMGNIYGDVILFSSGSRNRHAAFVMHTIHANAPRTVTAQFGTADIKLFTPVTIATVRQGHTIEIYFSSPFGVEVHRPRLPTIRSIVGLHRTRESRCRSYQYIRPINGIGHWSNAHGVEARNIIQIHGRTICKHATHGKIGLNQ